MKKTQYNRFISISKQILIIMVYSITGINMTYAKNLGTMYQPVSAKNGMVSSQESIATEVGLKILKQGGNAVDAAVSVGFALAVTYPQAGNLGGGGFMMIHLAKENKNIALDYREMAPAAASRDMFLDDKGNVDNQKARFSHLSSGVPGTVAGMLYALDKYGTMNVEQVIAPALELAEAGLIVSENFSKALKSASQRMKKTESTRKTFYADHGNSPLTGDNFKQADLAKTLKIISQQGTEGFYKGEIAQLISSDSIKHGGIITLNDLAHYKVIERQPIHGTYHGFDIFSMPPPSSGGVHLIQMLNILEGWNLQKSGVASTLTINHMAEAMKRAYADRSVHLGDPDFFDVPVKQLTSKHYADDLRKQINNRKFTPSSEIHPGKLPPYESEQTTHYSVVDKEGNAVANTYTLNATFGNARVAEGTGFIMNNEMDDFSAKPGTANMYGLIGGTANAIEPGKRPLSSMTPTLVLKDNEIFMVTGSPGGSRIINAVLQIIINVIDHKMNVADATVAPRFHHQWYPESLLMEDGFNSDTIAQLRAIGYSIDTPESHGNLYTPTGRHLGFLQSIVKKDGVLTGAADPRKLGSLALGY